MWEHLHASCAFSPDSVTINPAACRHTIIIILVIHRIVLIALAGEVRVATGWLTVSLSDVDVFSPDVDRIVSINLEHQYAFAIYYGNPRPFALPLIPEIMSDNVCTRSVLFIFFKTFLVSSTVLAVSTICSTMSCVLANFIRLLEMGGKSFCNLMSDLNLSSSSELKYFNVSERIFVADIVVVTWKIKKITIFMLDRM